MLNAFDIRAFLRFHRARRAEISIALTRVKDPTQYGLVLADEKGYVRRFLEKPSWDEVETNTINAGAYLFEPSGVLATSRPARPTRWSAGCSRSAWPPERSSAAGSTPGYWIDIGTVEKYLQVHLDILEGRTPVQARARRAHAEGDRRRAKVAAGAGVRVAPFARFSGAVSLGRGVSIGRGASLSRLRGPRRGVDRRRRAPGALHRRRRGAVGTHATLGPGAALAGGSRVGDYSQL